MRGPHSPGMAADAQGTSPPAYGEGSASIQTPELQLLLQQSVWVWHGPSPTALQIGAAALVPLVSPVVIRLSEVDAAVLFEIGASAVFESDSGPGMLFEVAASTVFDVDGD